MKYWWESISNLATHQHNQINLPQIHQQQSHSLSKGRLTVKLRFLAKASMLTRSISTSTADGPSWMLTPKRTRNKLQLQMVATFLLNKFRQEISLQLIVTPESRLQKTTFQILIKFKAWEGHMENQLRTTHSRNRILQIKAWD